MRLIDADKIKRSVENEMLKAELNSEIYCTLECVIADIESQPTAYDADKVIKQLEELKDISIGIRSHCCDCAYEKICEEAQKSREGERIDNFCELAIKNLVRKIIKADLNQ